MKLGLCYLGELVAVMGFSKRRGVVTLDRYATKIGTSVVGGFSKLFSKAPFTGTVVTHSMNRYSDGKLYAAAGFKPINRTRYTLQYTDKSKVYPREKFQKYKLKDWPGYSEEKTANEIVMENGILPIYAAGVTTWEIDLSTKMR